MFPVVSFEDLFRRLSQANLRNAPTPPPAATPIVPREPIANPYASAAVTPAESGFEGAPKERVGRQFRFNPKGKYVQIANQVRQEQQLEQLKQRIAESAKKAGLDSEFETLEKNIRVSVLMYCTNSVCLLTAPYSEMRLLQLSGGMQPFCRTRRMTTWSWACPSSTSVPRTPP